MNDDDQTFFLSTRDIFIGVCGGTRYLGKQGSVTIKSPDYPGHYRKNVDCEWTVRGPPGLVLLMQDSFLAHFTQFPLNRSLSYTYVC